jgi:hypothetical protein
MNFLNKKHWRMYMVKEKNLFTKVIALLHFKQKSGVLNRYNSLISPFEFYTRKSTKHSKSVQELISILSPNKFKGELKRFGHEGDGSYVLPKNIVSPKTYLISGGISDNNKFEIELAKKGVTGIQVDNSISKAPEEHKNLIFKFATLGDRDGLYEVSLENLISMVPLNKNLIVKLDIEGAEISALQHLSKKSLKRINCLVLELHNLSTLVQNEKILQTLSKLKGSGLSSIYLQANNGILDYVIAGVLIPDNIEITFVRKDYVSKLSSKDVQRIKNLTTKNNKKNSFTN